MNDDRQLLAAWAAEHREEAFRELVDRHIHLVWTAAFRVTHDADTARDIAQIVFTELARKGARLPAAVHLPGWLHRSAVLESLRHNRTSARRAQREGDAMQQLSEPHTAPEDPAAVDRLLPVLDAALVELDDTDRQAVMLRFFGSKNFAEIGASIGSSDDAAQKRVSRALERLRGAFLRKGIVVTSGLVAAAMHCAAAQTAPPQISLGIATASLAAPIAGTPWIWILAMKAQLALGTLALVSTAAVWFWTPRSAVAAVPTVVDSPAASPGPTGAPQPDERSSNVWGTFDWAQVESNDYRRYADNLRAIGCPEEMIQDIVSADVHKVMVGRFRHLVTPSTRGPWWKKPQPNVRPSEELLAQQSQAQLEEQAILHSILGNARDPQSLVDQMFLQPDSSSLALGFLSEEKWRQALQALANSGVRTLEANEPPDDGRDFDIVESGRLERRMAVLKDILTPDELKQYRRRASSWMQVLFYQFAYFDGTEEEFEKLSTLHEGNLRRRMIFWGNEPMTGVKAALGAERYEDLRKASDPAYRLPRMAAERFELSPDVADAAFEVKRATLAEVESIRNRTALAESERQSRLAHLRADAETQLREHLGTNAFQMVSKLGGTHWMKFIEEPAP